MCRVTKGINYSVVQANQKIKYTNQSINETNITKF